MHTDLSTIDWSKFSKSDLDSVIKKIQVVQKDRDQKAEAQRIDKVNQDWAKKNEAKLKELNQEKTTLEARYNELKIQLKDDSLSVKVHNELKEEYQNVGSKLFRVETDIKKMTDKKYHDDSLECNHY